MGYADTAGPIALVHRGGGALETENTLAAFARSTALGFRYLETDVRSTADGAVVCFHDAGLERITDGRGPVEARTLSELRRLRLDGAGDGRRICTLEEALDAFPEAYFSADLKDVSAIGPLVDLLRRPGVAERVCVAGAWDGWLRIVRDAVPGVATSLGWRSLTSLIACSRLGVRPPRWVASAPFAHVPLRLGNVPVFVERVVEMAHDLDVRIVTWTVDEPGEIARLLDAGVDAVITDRPDVLREVFLQRGLWQPMRAGGESGATPPAGSPCAQASTGRVGSVAARLSPGG